MALAGLAGHYTFVSSISAYASPIGSALDESEPLAQTDAPDDEAITETSYGPLKALCEREVRDGMDGRAIVVRPGLIGGPLDPTDRFTYWPHRFSLGGDVLVPSPPARPISFIDVRDLADWIVRAASAGVVGDFNASGDPGAVTMGALVDSCRRSAGVESTPVFVDQEFLLERGVAPWSDLPLWLTESDASAMAVSSRKARAAGLSYRSLDDTVTATLQWSRRRGPEVELRAGLSRERERSLLDEWRRSTR